MNRKLAVAFLLVGFLLVPGVSAQSCGEVKYWGAFNTSTPIDYSGCGNDGVINGSLNTSATGISRSKGDWNSGAYGFNDSNGFVDLGQISSLNSSNLGDSFSSSVWVKLESTSSGQDRILTHGSSNSNDNFALWTESGQLKYYLDVPTGGGVLTGSTLNTGEWYHVLTVYNGSHQLLYLNGSLDASQAASGSIADASNGYWTVGNQYGATKNFKGVIDEPRLGQSTFNDSEVSNLFQYNSLTNTSSGSGNSFSCPNISSNSSISGFWKLNESSSSTACDYSGSENAFSMSEGYTQGVSGVFNSAYSFNGTGYGTTSTSPINSDKSFTVTAFIKTSDQQGQIRILNEQNSNYVGYNFAVNKNGNGFVNLALGDGTNFPIADSTTAVNDGSWYHVAGVYNSSSNNLSVYVNGTKEGEVSSSLGDTEVNDVLALAAKSGGVDNGISTGQRWNGTLDEVKIYPSALTSAEVSSDMNKNYAFANAQDFITSVELLNPSNGSQVDSGSTNFEYRPNGTKVSGSELLLQKEYDTLKFGIMGDTHFNFGSYTRADDVQNETATKERLNQFSKDMNNWGADMFFHMGDIMTRGNTTTPLANNVVGEEGAIRRINEVQQWMESNISAPGYWMMGNHEYKGDCLGYQTNDGDPQWNYSNIRKAVNSSWGSTSDTWYSFEKKGYRFIVLNTAVNCGGQSERLNHTIPQEEVDWLKNKLGSTDAPTLAFMHVPVSNSTGLAYDQATNQDQVLQAFSNDDDFIGGFYGHVHHEEGWDRIRKEVDRYGNRWWALPTPAGWRDSASDSMDYSERPWGKITIKPVSDGFNVSVGDGVNRSQVTATTEWDETHKEFTAQDYSTSKVSNSSEVLLNQTNMLTASLDTGFSYRWNLNVSANSESQFAPHDYFLSTSSQNTADSTPPTSSDNWTASGYVDKSSTIVEITSSDSESSVSNITYWLNGNKNIVQNNTTDVSINNEGNNSLVYRATDSNGNIESNNTEYVAISPLPSVRIDSPLNKTYNFTQQETPSVDLNVSSGTTINKWVYNNDSKSNQSFSPNITLSGFSEGSHTTTVFAKDDEGQYNNSDVTFFVAVNDDPSASFTTSTSDLTVSVDASGSSDGDGTINKYEWDWTSDGTYDATGKTASHDYGSEGDYDITLRVTDDDGATSTSTKTVSVSSGSSGGGGGGGSTNSKPTVTIYKPEYKNYSKDSIPYKFMPDDSDGNLDTCKIYLDDNNPSTVSCSEGSNSSGSLTTSNVGAHSFTVNVTDTDGAYRYKTQNFTVFHENVIKSDNTQGNTVNDFTLTVSNSTTSFTKSTSNGKVLFNTSNLPYGDNVTFQVKSSGFQVSKFYKEVNGSTEVNKTVILSKANITFDVNNEGNNKDLYKFEALVKNSSSDKTIDTYFTNKTDFEINTKNVSLPTDKYRVMTKFKVRLTDSNNFDDNNDDNRLKAALKYFNGSTEIIGCGSNISDNTPDVVRTCNVPSKSLKEFKYFIDYKSGSAGTGNEGPFDPRLLERNYTLGQDFESSYGYWSNAMPTGSLEISFEKQDYKARQYFETWNGFNNVEVEAYLLKSSEGDRLPGVKIIKQTGETVEGATVDLKRRINGVFKIVDSRTSSDSGRASFFVDPDITYRVTVSKKGFITKTSDYVPSSYQFSPKKIVIRKEGNEIKPGYFNYIEKISADCDYNVTAVQCSYTSTTTDLSNMSLFVEKDLAKGSKLVNLSSSLKENDTVTVTGLNASNNKYIYRLEADFTTGVNLTVKQGVFGKQKDPYGVTGVFASLLLVWAVGFATSWKPEALVTGVLFAVSVSAFLPFLQIGVTTLSALIALGAALLWRMNK